MFPTPKDAERANPAPGKIYAKQGGGEEEKDTKSEKEEDASCTVSPPPPPRRQEDKEGGGIKGGIPGNKKKDGWKGGKKIVSRHSLREGEEGKEGGCVSGLLLLLLLLLLLSFHFHPCSLAPAASQGERFPLLLLSNFRGRKKEGIRKRCKKEQNIFFPSSRRGVSRILSNPEREEDPFTQKKERNLVPESTWN